MVVGPDVHRESYLIAVTFGKATAAQNLQWSSTRSKVNEAPDYRTFFRQLLMTTGLPVQAHPAFGGCV